MYPKYGRVEAHMGVLDLRQAKNPDHFIVSLNGEWEFYWGKMLHPHDFKQGLFKPDYHGNVPSYWTEYPSDSVKTERHGYATYRLSVLLPEGLSKALAFDMPVFDSSYDIYINDVYFGGNGVPGKNPEESEPGYRRNFFRYVPQSDTLSIIINVSNFDHRRGGFWMPARMGTFQEVQRRLAARWAGDWSVISLLTAFAVFFLFFFILSPGEKVMGFFSIATLALALRPLFTSNFLVLNFVEMHWEWIVRLEYLDLYLIIMGWAWVIRYIYPSVFFRIYTLAVTTIFGIAFAVTLFVPPVIFTFSIKLFYPALLVLMIYPVICSFRGILAKSKPDYAYFSAFILLLGGGVHDIRVSMGLADSASGYILTYLMVIFVIIQACLLLYKWMLAFREKEKLREKMEYMNQNLENLVNERTREIQLRNEEIEDQSLRIEKQNKQLSDTIQAKDRLFAVIAHDLRSPVVNILYMLNLLKEDEYRDKYDSFANSCIKYAQMVISLLENMLVWGRDQENRIKYSPGNHDLARIILTNLSIFKESADMKDIVINFTQAGDSTGYVDKDLFDIVIRNLLSNAVKYTYRGGRISILLRNKSKTSEGFTLKVCDNGIGIAPEKQKSLFDSGEVESTPGTEDEKGTGLGLKLCHELVQLNRGTLEVESRPGEGTCFIIWIPSP